MTTEKLGMMRQISAVTPTANPEKCMKDEVVEEKDKFTPWIPPPKIEGYADYFKNAVKSVWSGMAGFGVVAAGKTILKLETTGRNSGVVGLLKDCVILSAGVTGAAVGAVAGLGMGIVGKNAGSLIPAKHMQDK